LFICCITVCPEDSLVDLVVARHILVLREEGRLNTMVLADLGRKITTALRSLSNATVINEEVRCGGLLWWGVDSTGDVLIQGPISWPSLVHGTDCAVL